MLTVRQPDHGLVTVISGPVDSDKNSRLVTFLNAVKSSGVVQNGFTSKGPVVVFRHPRDERRTPSLLGSHQIHVTNSVEEMYNGIGKNTGTVVIAGASHYDLSLPLLIEGLARSNRQVIAAGLNLEASGRPFGIMPELMALSDNVLLAKAICFQARGPGSCGELAVSRSVRLEDGGYSAACIQHANQTYSESIAHGNLGRLTLDCGPMFSGKSTEWSRRLEKFCEAGLTPLVFRYLGETERYGDSVGEVFGEGNISLHSGETVTAVNIRTGAHIEEYLRRMEDKASRFLFLDEAQFPSGLYGTALKLLDQGYQIYMNHLVRTFNGGGFMEGPKLMCLADEIYYHSSNCVAKTPKGLLCGRPAKESQRMVMRAGSLEIGPARVTDSVEMIAGSNPEVVNDTEDRAFYQASCRRHLTLPGEKPNEFTFEEYAVR